MRIETKIWVEGTVMAALGIVLSFIPLSIGSSFTISLGQIPIIIFALRRGVKPGLLAGLVWGLLHFLTGQAQILTVSQAIIEYPIADLFLGLAGLYAVNFQQALRANQVTKMLVVLIQAVLVGTFARFFWHFVAGWIFWGAYAMWGLQPWLFSLVMNGISGLATAVVTAVVAILLVRIPAVYLPKTKRM